MRHLADASGCGAVNGDAFDGGMRCLPGFESSNRRNYKSKLVFSQ